MPIFRMPVVLHANCPYANRPHANSPATKKNYKENGKISNNKIYFIFYFTYTVQILFELVRE